MLQKQDANASFVMFFPPEFLADYKYLTLSYFIEFLKITQLRVYHYSYFIDEETKTREIRFTHSDTARKCKVLLL